MTLDLDKDKDRDATTELVPHDPFAIPLDPENSKLPRVVLAYQLRVAGASYEDIADKLGYASADNCRSTVLNHIKSFYKAEDAEEIVALEMARLDALQLVAWKSAREGDTRAMQTILKIMERRAKYLGLDKAPETGGSNNNTTNTAIFIGGDEKSYVEQLQKARQALDATTKE